MIDAYDADRAEMTEALRKFGVALRAAGPDAVGLFYYAGHGVQADGANFLIPLKASIGDSPADLQIAGLTLMHVLTKMKRTGNAVNLIILDACRDNPYENKFPAEYRSSTHRGLARISKTRGAIIAFSAAPGQKAEDGNGKNSPFTAALADEIVKPGVPVEQMLKRVRIRVEKATGERQTPWDQSSLRGDFYFVPANLPDESSHSANTAHEVAQDPKPGQSRESVRELQDLEYWNYVKDKKSVRLLNLYLKKHPQGRFRELAVEEVSRLRKLSNPDENVAQPLGSDSADVSEETHPKISPDDLEPVSDKPQIRAAQQKLYDLNYDPGPIDGALGPRTSDALRDYQEAVGLEVTGELTVGLLDRLRKEAAPANWGVLGFSTSTGRLAQRTRLTSRSVAEQAIRKTCGDCDKVLPFHEHECAAIALTKTHWGWARRENKQGDRQATLQAARNGALKNCKDSGGVSCQVKVAVCAKT